MHTFVRSISAATLSALVGTLSLSTGSAACHSAGWRTAATAPSHHIKPARKPMSTAPTVLARRRPDTSDGHVTHRHMAAMLGISRSQLYRWQKLADYPAVARPVRRRGQRLYSREAQAALIAYRDKVDPIT